MFLKLDYCCAFNQRTVRTIPFFKFHVTRLLNQNMVIIKSFIFYLVEVKMRVQGVSLQDVEAEYVVVIFLVLNYIVRHGDL